MATCVLCGEARPRSKEDAVPRWVNAMLSRSRTGPFATVIDGRLSEVTAQPRRIITRRPCVDCNAWMNTHFEQPARPILEPMMEYGSSRSLSMIEQRTVAGWLAKTTLMIRLFARAKQQFPEDAYRRLRAEGTPGDSIAVWLGVRSDCHGPGTVTRSTPKAIPRTVVPGCTASTWSLGHLVAQVIYDAAGRFKSIQNNGELHGMLIRVWPVTIGDALWPPRHVLDADDVVELGLNIVA